MGSALRFTEEFHSVTSSSHIRTDAGSQIVFGADYSGFAETFFGEGEVHFHGQVDPFLVSSSNDINGTLLFEGDVFLESTGNLVLDFGDATQGAFEKFEVLGNLHLDGEISINFLNGGLMEIGQEYLIAEIAGDQFGQFSGLPEGGLAAYQDGIGLFISYSGGDGNDVSLSAVAIPEPESAFAVSVVMALACLRRKRKQTVRVAPTNSKPELRHSRIRNAF